MKWYRKEHRDRFLHELKETIRREVYDRFVLKYSPLAFKHARKVNLEESKVGILNVQDIEQAAFSGLIEGWDNVDWDKVNKADDPEKRIINYLSSYIERQIKREIYRDATGVAIPEYQITKTKREEAVDRLFGNWLYSFRSDDFVAGNYRYTDALEAEPPLKYWETMDLNDKLTDIMLHLPARERDIVNMSFGIMMKKPMSSKDIAEELGIKPDNVRKIQQRALSKLRTQENRELFKDFL